MAYEQDLPPVADAAIDPAMGSAPDSAPLRSGRKRRVLVALALLLLAGIAAGWLLRKDIADDIIAGQLESLDLPGRYEVVSIGPSEQVVRNLVIGDPRRPDLTVDELRIATRLYWGLPGIGRITVVRPRLYGTYHGGRISFGSLDKALFSGKGEPFRMPDLDLALVDGRALIESDFGPIAARLEGEGQLRDGFEGELAAMAPGLAIAGCKVGKTTAYGAITIQSEQPRFVGPVRAADMACTGQAFAMAQAGARIDVTLDKTLDGAEASIGLNALRGRLADNSLQRLSGTADLTWRKHALNVRYHLAGRALSTPQARFAELSLEGRARSADGFARFDVEGDLGGKGLVPGADLDRALASAGKAGRGTFLVPLAAQVRGALVREARGGTLAANLIVRRTDEGLSVVAPHGAIKGRSGAALLTLSRAQAMFGDGRQPRLTGNFATGGRGLPQLSGRMESGARGGLVMRLAMPEYQAPGTRIALPELTLVQRPDGHLAFTGQVALSGDLPGGRVEQLRLPVEGHRSVNGELSLWPRCARVAFDKLRLANLEVLRRTVPVCPGNAPAIVRLRDGRLSLAAGVSALDLAGRLGETPIRIVSGPLAFVQDAAMPGTLRASAVKVELGAAAAPSRFSVAELSARFGGDVGGTFGGADAGLAAVPLDMRRMAGNWRYTDGVLAIYGAGLTLVDREPAARFNPMIARDAGLRLAGNVITASALLREPGSDREVVRADILHDLGAASGHADLAIDGIRFDGNLQADTLSALALGVVSNLEGLVRGRGRIDWNADAVTSHGRFGTDGVDFAAAFGPVKGLAGEVVFTDLLGLVTAPSQTLRIASINPGIEVIDGTLSFAMKPGHVLQIEGARWPFMGGTLTLDPARMQIGIAETRYYTLRVSGFDAGTFVRRLELANLNATGVFDGKLPLVFDENGGRIVDGHLVSRPPGGNVSYVGELTYKDLSAMGNFAFDTLRSVDYRQMEITLGGTLAGEIITRVSFSGISQGMGAKRNLLTRQVAKLPIRFVLNVKAPFFSLFAPLRSLYDPSYLPDPRMRGLVGDDGRPVAQPPSIQPPVSENRP